MSFRRILQSTTILYRLTHPIVRPIGSKRRVPVTVLPTTPVDPGEGFDRNTFPPPPVQVGGGKAVTGGRGKPVYVVTTGATGRAQGTIRKALEQGDCYIIITCNADFFAEDTNDPDTGKFMAYAPNITVDARFAPGTTALFAHARIEPEADNQKWINIIHQGNLPGQADERVGSSAADNVRIGRFSSDNNGTHVTQGQYWVNCLFMNGMDEAWTAAPRAIPNTGGNKATHITLENSVVYAANAFEHQMAIYLSGGVEDCTIIRNFFPPNRARAPAFVRAQTARIELINNWIYDFRQRATEMLGDSIHVIGNYYKHGPRSTSTGQVLYGYGSSQFYEEDNITTRPPLIGGEAGYTVAGSKLFTDSDYDLVPASEVPTLLPEIAGPRMYGGARFPLVELFFAEAEDGTLPLQMRTYSNNDTIEVNGGTYPAHNGSYVPLAYLDLFPEDEDLAAIIADGTSWDGYMVAERVGFWFHWDGTLAEPPTEPVLDPAVLQGTYPFAFAQATEQVSVDLPAGQRAIFAIGARSIDTIALDEAASSYNAANLRDLGVTVEASPQTLGVAHRLYEYTSDGSPALFVANNEGGTTLRRAVSGLAFSGGQPAQVLGSTNGTDNNSSTISVPGGTVQVGDVVVTLVSSGIDDVTQAITAATAAGLTDVSVVHWGHNNTGSGLGHYWIVGTATATTVGPVTADQGVADYWNGTTLVIGSAA